MKKNKPKPIPAIEINDFFGTTKDYYLFAARSSLTLLQLSAKLATYLQRDIAFIGTYQPDNQQFTANFNLTYGTWSEEDKTQLIIIENRTNDGETKVVSKTERNLSFHTLSLFDDFYYIFNVDGLHLAPWQFADVDFLCLIYTKKEFDISELRALLEDAQFLQIEPMIEITDAPCMFSKEEKKAQKNHIKTIQNVQNLIFEFEDFASQFQVKRISNLLAPCQQISQGNFVYQPKFNFDNDIFSAKNSITEDFESPYLPFLTSE